MRRVAFVLLALAWVLAWLACLPLVPAATCTTDTDCGCTDDCLE